MIEEHRDKVARLCLEWDRTDAKNAGDKGFALACEVTSLLYALGLVRGGKLTSEGETLANEARVHMAECAAIIAKMEQRMLARSKQ